MSDPAWTTGTAPPEGGEETRALTTPPGEGPGQEPAHADAPEGHPDDAPEAMARSPRVGHEVRFGVAALMSFVILVVVLVLNKGRDRTKAPDDAGKAPPLALINRGELARATTSTPDDAPKPKPVPAPEGGAGATPPAPMPVPQPSTDAVLQTAAPADGSPPAPAPAPAPVPAPAPAPTPEAPKPQDAASTTPAPTPVETPTPVAENGPGGSAATPPAPAPTPDATAAVETPIQTPAAVETPTAAAPAPVPTPLADPAPVATPPAPVATPGDSGTVATPPAPVAAPAPTPGEAAATPAPANPVNVNAPAPLSTPLTTPTPAPPQATADPAPAATPLPDAAAATTPGLPADGVTPAEPPPATPALPPPDAPAATAPDAVPTPAEPPKPATTPTPTPTTTPAAAPTPVHGDVPNLAPAPTDASPPAGPAHDSGRGEIVKLPNAGLGRMVLDADPRSPEPPPVRPEPEALTVPESLPVSVRSDPASAAGGRGVASGTSPGPNLTPAATVDDRAADRIEAVPHVVERGENFFTIAQLYYGSGRFYKALWAANRSVAPAPETLYVGQTIRVPPPEALDRSLIEPPKARTVTSATKDRPTGPVRRASRTPGEVEVALPTSDPFAKRGAGDDADGPSPGTRPRRPVYKVRPHETLRSIARDTLGDSRRAAEILELNADAVDDPNRLVAGQILELPDDAKTGRRTR